MPTSHSKISFRNYYACLTMASPKEATMLPYPHKQIIPLRLRDKTVKLRMPRNLYADKIEIDETYPKNARIGMVLFYAYQFQYTFANEDINIDELENVLQDEVNFNAYANLCKTPEKVISKTTGITIQIGDFDELT